METCLSTEAAQRSPVRNDCQLQADESLVEIVKRLKERVELLETTVKKMPASEGKTCKVNFDLTCKK